MRITRPAAEYVLLSSRHRDGGEPLADATAGRAVSDEAVLWQSKDGRGLGRPGPRGQPQACATADAADGHRSAGATSIHVAAGQRSSCVPLFVARGEHHAFGPRVERGYHVYSAAWRLRVPGGDHRLVQSLCAVLEIVRPA